MALAEAQKLGRVTASQLLEWLTCLGCLVKELPQIRTADNIKDTDGNAIRFLFVFVSHIYKFRFDRVVGMCSHRSRLSIKQRKNARVPVPSNAGFLHQNVNLIKRVMVHML